MKWEKVDNLENYYHMVVKILLNSSSDIFPSLFRSQSFKNYSQISGSKNPIASSSSSFDIYPSPF